MSIPLTIEELKALEVGDWVWVVTLQDAYRPNDVPYGEYYKIMSTKNNYYLTCTNNEKLNYWELAYSDYGATWLAYKNKEQAEGKENSLAVQLEVAERDISNLEWTIEELHEVLSANGISIDSDGNVNVEQVRKEVAKEILTKLLQWKSSVIFDTESIITAEKSFEKSIKALAIEEYGVEVDE